MQYHSPQEIESESMRIIEQEAGKHSFTPEEWTIVKRIIHATADFDVMDTIRFHTRAIASGILSIRDGRPVYADTGMLSAAITKRVKEIYGCPVVCLVGDAEVRKASAASGETRSTIALRTSAPQLKRGIIAIGNAPTALTEALRLCKEGLITPDLIIGMPVGFVGAAESKDNLLDSGLACITMLGRKGGTAAAAATINALVQLAGDP
ncbi:MAG: precorrin-8X methylmutase [Proteobacteria bacterium]|nr:precorrin-8X methylmutase [Pseudomonadota bacterium]